MVEFKIVVYVTLENGNDAKDLAEDLHSILNANGIINSVYIEQEES